MEAEARKRVICLCPGGTDYYCYSKCKSHLKGPEAPPGEQVCGSRVGTLPKRNAKGTEPSLTLSAREVGMASATGTPQLPGEEGDRSQDVWQWMLESEQQSKSRPHSAQSIRKSSPLESARGSPGERISRHHLLGASEHPLLSGPGSPIYPGTCNAPQPHPTLWHSWKKPAAGWQRWQSPRSSSAAWPVSSGTGTTRPLVRQESHPFPTQAWLQKITKSKETGKYPHTPGQRAGCHLLFLWRRNSIQEDAEDSELDPGLLQRAAQQKGKLQVLLQEGE